MLFLEYFSHGNRLNVHSDIGLPVLELTCPFPYILYQLTAQLSTEVRVVSLSSIYLSLNLPVSPLFPANIDLQSGKGLSLIHI